MNTVMNILGSIKARKLILLCLDLISAELITTRVLELLDVKMLTKFKFFTFLFRCLK